MVNVNIKEKKNCMSLRQNSCNGAFSQPTTGTPKIQSK